ncbi:hypothetical protein MHYP_G00254480 [Metynnis hypsauchen]
MNNQRKKRVPAPSLPGSSSISTCHWQETVLRYCSHIWKLTCHPALVSLQVSFICLQKPAVCVKQRVQLTLKVSPSSNYLIPPSPCQNNGYGNANMYVA